MSAEQPSVATYRMQQQAARESHPQRGENGDEAVELLAKWSRAKQKEERDEEEAAARVRQSLDYGAQQSHASLSYGRSKPRAGSRAAGACIPI